MARPPPSPHYPRTVNDLPRSHYKYPIIPQKCPNAQFNPLPAHPHNQLTIDVLLAALPHTHQQLTIYDPPPPFPTPPPTSCQTPKCKTPRLSQGLTYGRDGSYCLTTREIDGASCYKHDHRRHHHQLRTRSETMIIITIANTISQSPRRTTLTITNHHDHHLHEQQKNHRHA